MSVADVDIDIAREHEALLQFLYIAPIGLIQARIDGEILLANPMCARVLLPLAPGGSMVNLFVALESIAPDLRQRVAAFDAPSGMVCDALQLPIRAEIGAGRQPQVLSLTLLKLDADRLMAVISDVSQAVRREQALRQSQAWINAIAAGLNDYLVTTLDARGHLERWNQSVARLVGLSRAETIGAALDRLYPPGAMPETLVSDRLQDADASGWSLDEGWMQRADGSRFWGSSLIAPLDLHDPNDAGSHSYSLIVRDVDDRRDATQALLQAVARDHLTGLHNRRAFFETLEHSLRHHARQPRPLALLMIDADHFKRINDGHGHAVGDAVLRHLAAALTAAARSTDVAARIGGEEFALLLPGTDEDGARDLAERLMGTIARQPCRVGPATVNCTVSIGIALLRPGVDGVDALLERADRALYAAKEAGRNRALVWDVSMVRCAAHGDRRAEDASG